MKTGDCHVTWCGHGGLTWLRHERSSVESEWVRLRLGRKLGGVTDSHSSLFSPGIDWTTNQTWKDMEGMDVHIAKWKQSVDDILSSSNSMTFCTRQNYRDSRKISGCRGQGGGMTRWNTYSHLVFLFFFWLLSVACGILVSQAGIEPRPSAVRARSPNHWTTREFPTFSTSRYLYIYGLMYPQVFLHSVS